MGKNTYRYNPETCTYERAGVTSGRVLSFVLTLLFTTLLLFVALLWMQYRYFPAEKELALREENSAMTKHQKILNASLESATASLAALDAQDARINNTLFPIQEKDERVSTAEAAANLLVTDASNFFTTTDMLMRYVDAMSMRSNRNDVYFSMKINVKPEDVGFLAAIPTQQPIDNPNQDKLISGYGTRINPFHKGNYDHPGVDFADARGTPVIATADGVIMNIVRSSLEAGYGNYIDINHNNGFMTRYAHLGDVSVRAGQRVKKGTVIATLGSSGGSVAPHVHYELFRNGKRIDPAPFMIEGLSSSEYDRLTQYANRQNQSLD